MKNRSWLIFVIFSLLFLVSCGGNENDAEEAGDGDGENAVISIRAVKDASCTGMQIDCLSQQLTAISFQIRNGEGETIFQKSVDRKSLGSKHLEFNGIKNADNATLIVSAFGLGSDGLPDLNMPKWVGQASGLKFEKGEKTSVIVLLYPRDVQAKEISMPEELITARFGHTSTVLADGRVLVAGGFTSCSALGKCPATKKVEIIDLESGRVEALSDMAEERAMHTAVALNDGGVLFIGGVHTFDVNWQETAFANFPFMRYVPSTATVTIEKYMPSYPKYNMKMNGFGSPVANISQPLSAANIPFSVFQSVLAERISDSEIAVFLVGGLDENGEPSKKSYKFSITEAEDGTISVGEVSEMGETSEPLLLPALGYANGGVIAAGGRPSDSKYAASYISDESEDFGSASDNVFFAKSLNVNGTLYTFGGYGVESGALAESKSNKIRRWNASGKSVEESKDLLLTRGNNIVFPETAYDSKNGRLFVIGGTNAADIFQVINEASFELYSKAPTHTMGDKRIMSSAAIVPAGVVGDLPIIVITGGISTLDSAGTLVKNIKINNL